nr:hypothetical protein [Tanacetum cinerariifolium]
MSPHIDFSSYVMNNLKIDNLTQEHLIEPAFNLLKRTCRSRVELENIISKNVIKLKAYSLKRDHEDEDKDEDPPTGSDQGLKKRRQASMLNHQKALNIENQSQAHPKEPSLSRNHL